MKGGVFNSALNKFALAGSADLKRLSGRNACGSHFRSTALISTNDDGVFSFNELTIVPKLMYKVSINSDCIDAENDRLVCFGRRT